MHGGAHRPGSVPNGRRPAGQIRARRRRTRRHYFLRRVAVVAGVALVCWLVLQVVGGSAHSGHKSGAGDRTSTTTTDPEETAVDPAEFATGACEEFRPTSGNNHTVVFLDAGHGGIDPGGVGTTESGQTIYEADQTLPVELDAMALLRAAGFTVVVSRTSNTTVVKLDAADVSNGVLSLQGAHADVAARDICANMAHAQLLVGIYFDSGATPENAGSVTGYDADRPFSADNLRFATLLQHDVLGDLNAEGLDIPDEGVLPDTGLGSEVPTDSDSGLAAEAASYDHLLLLGPADPGYFSTPSEMPGAVIEPLFVTDPFEGSVAVSTSGRETIARGIAQAVEQYFAPSSTTSTTSTTAAGSA